VGKEQKIVRKQQYPGWHLNPPLRGILVFAAALFVMLGPQLMAQGASPSIPVLTEAGLPAYDVVSIKPNKTGSGRTSIDTNNGNFIASNITLKTLILIAYNLKEGQLIDLPKWAESSHFDIQAKVLEPDKKVFDALTDEQAGAMLQPILADRFQLKFHHETKALPVYELVVVKDGPKFKESKISGDQKSANGMGAGSMSSHNSSTNGVMTSTTSAVAIPIASLTAMLSTQLQRIVVDKTGLTGKYDLELVWTRDDSSNTTSDATGVSVFTALQEQLGLKLQPSKSPVETIVIDHLELPSEN
jgi:uncharacterized protein (TIGR03435 family)